MDGELLRFCRWYEIVWGRGSTYLKAIPQENIVILIRHHNPKKDPNWLHIRQETELSLRWMKERTRAYKKSQPKKTKKKPKNLQKWTRIEQNQTTVKVTRRPRDQGPQRGNELHHLPNLIKWPL